MPTTRSKSRGPAKEQKQPTFSGKEQPTFSGKDQPTFSRNEQPAFSAPVTSRLQVPFSEEKFAFGIGFGQIDSEQLSLVHNARPEGERPYDRIRNRMLSGRRDRRRRVQLLQETRQDADEVDSGSARGEPTGKRRRVFEEPKAPSTSSSPSKRGTTKTAQTILDILGGGVGASGSSPVAGGEDVMMVTDDAVTPVSKLLKKSQFVVPNVAESPVVTSSKSNAWVLQLPVTPGQWNCSVCLVDNAPSATQCACCEAPKPPGSVTAKPAETPIKPAHSMAVSSGMFVNTQFAPKSEWTCSVCLVPNKMDQNKCACCEEPRPGAMKSDSKTSSAEKPKITSSGFSFPGGVKFNAPANPPTEQSAPSGGFKFSFGGPTDGSSPFTFSFGSKPAEVQEISGDKTMEDKSALSKDQSSISVTNDKIWYCSVCNVDNKPSASICVCCEAPKPGSAPPVKTPPSQSSSGPKITSAGFSFPGVPAGAFKVSTTPATIPEVKPVASSVPAPSSSSLKQDNTLQQSTSLPTFAFPSVEVVKIPDEFKDKVVKETVFTFPSIQKELAPSDMKILCKCCAKTSGSSDGNVFSFNNNTPTKLFNPQKSWVS